jgi:hypothetical protein
MERGELNVQMPLVNLQVSYLERSLNRLIGAVIFLALVLSGAVLYSTNETAGRILMGVSGFALFYTLILARGHRPW